MNNVHQRLRPGKGDRVMLARGGGHFMPVAVETGIENGDFDEIADGLAEGAQVTVEDRDQAFPVALDGEVYVTGLTDANRLSARWNGQACTVEVPAAPSLSVSACGQHQAGRRRYRCVL